MERSATWPGYRWRLRAVKIPTIATRSECVHNSFFPTLTSSESDIASNANSQVWYDLERDIFK